MPFAVHLPPPLARAVINGRANLSLPDELVAPASPLIFTALEGGQLFGVGSVVIEQRGETLAMTTGTVFSMAYPMPPIDPIKGCPTLFRVHPHPRLKPMALESFIADLAYRLEHRIPTSEKEIRSIWGLLPFGDRHPPRSIIGLIQALPSPFNLRLGEAWGTALQAGPPN